jgi:hypothetical protein
VAGKRLDYLRVFHACEVSRREGKTHCVEGKALAVDADISDTSELYQHPSNVISLRMRNYTSSLGVALVHPYLRYLEGHRGRDVCSAPRFYLQGNERRGLEGRCKEARLARLRGWGGILPWRPCR